MPVTPETGSTVLFSFPTKGVHYLRSRERAAPSTMNHRHPPEIPTDDESAQARGAARQLARLLPDGQRPLRLVTEGGGHKSISIPPGAVWLFLDALAQGRAVAVVRGKVELAAQEVADYLNVSLSCVVTLIKSGKLPARLVGTCHHISFADLIKFEEEDRKARRAALNELAQMDQKLKL